MKKSILYIMLAHSVISASFAAYTHTITEYQSLPHLFGTESMLITGRGGGPYTALFDNSSLTVENTSILEDGVGGVWQISLGESSSLNMLGGQVNEIDFHGEATATLIGGLIQQIWSHQTPLKWDNYNQQWVPNPHIKLYYSGDLPTQQNIGGYNYLVGAWGDGTGFQIYLPDTGYHPYDNFEFIPEPTTMLLLGLGGWLLRQKK